jgi:hypothetical protein
MTKTDQSRSAALRRWAALTIALAAFGAAGAARAAWAAWAGGVRWRAGNAGAGES